MKIRQAELKEVNSRALRSLDKSLKLVFYVNANENNPIDRNQLDSFMHQPLTLDVNIDK